MYRPYSLLLACPWMNREDLECNRCPYRDSPQLEISNYFMHKPWKDWTTCWQADECCSMGDRDCFKAAAPHSTFPLTLLHKWPEFIRE